VRPAPSWAFACFSVIGSGGLGCQGDSPAPQVADDEAEIRQFLETAGEAVSAGDVEAEVNRFTDDGIYMWPDAPAIEGREELREWFERRFALVEAQIQNQSQELVVSGDWAFERGTYVARIRPRAGTAVDTVLGKYVNVLRRQPDGSWKIAWRIRNRDDPVGER
jgi:ketosteroid isomerase-like protein